MSYNAANVRFRTTEVEVLCMVYGTSST